MAKKCILFRETINLEWESENSIPSDTQCSTQHLQVNFVKLILSMSLEKY